MTASPTDDHGSAERRIQEQTKELSQAKGELAEAREQQAATGGILRVISSSPADLQPVFAEIAASAAHLCDAYDAVIRQVDGEVLRLVAHHGPISAPDTIAVSRSSVIGCAVMDRRTIHVADLQSESDEYLESRNRALQLGHRTALGVPLVHAGKAVGVILIRRTEVHPFTDRQIDLLKTFADQAVIAIDNTRLFEAEQARTRELSESLEYQTAIGEVLGVISRSPNQLQPVLDTIVQTAQRLCQSDRAQFFRLDNGKYHLAAQRGTNPEFLRYLAENPISPEPGSGTTTSKAAREHRTIHVPDVLTDPEFAHGDRAGRGRSILAVPLIRDDVVIGVITVAQDAVRPFSDRQIELVETFARQALIAIENTRLFEEVQEKNRALTKANVQLTEALDQQTATSEILRVISGSPTDVQPVFNAIAEAALRLCGAPTSIVTTFDGELMHLVAQADISPEGANAFRKVYPLRPSRGSASGRAILTRAIVQVHDVTLEPEYEHRQLARLVDFRSILAVPMIRDGRPIGTINVHKVEAGPFANKQIALLQTFADQAVIAIENTRLFQEVQARNRDLTALGEVGRAVSSTLELNTVLKTIVDRAVELSGTDGGSIFYYRDAIARFELGETSGLEEEVVARFRKLDISAGQTGLGEAIAQRQPLQVPDILNRPSNPLRDAAIEAGFRAGLIVPLLGSESPLGALVLQRRKPGEFTPAVVSLMQAFADQSAIALENARLFEEIAQKGRELEIASQHKSQFVANMSHELRTPLAAILGYAELIQEGFYEPQGPKSLDALTRIRSNGKHLLGLINTVLDIAKIESGQFTLNMAEYVIETVVETVRSATESLAQNKKLALRTEVAKSLPVGLGDEQRLTQVLLNLVGNAIKFTDAGEVSITAGTRNGHFAVSVTDTGPGIPLDQQDRIFEQFHQVDSSNTKAKGGTGLGLAIAKQIVEMHGGRIWVESTIGKGSTFQMELPTRAQLHKKMP